jgi:hypothetical protein
MFADEALERDLVGYTQGTKSAANWYSLPSRCVFQGGQKVHYGPAVRWRRETPGTVVSIRDAFFNVRPHRYPRGHSLRNAISCQYVAAHTPTPREHSSW